MITIPSETMKKVERLAALMEVQKELDNIRRGFEGEVHMPDCKTKIIVGTKYIKLDQGGSGRLMIEITTGNIYGIKAYGKVHLGRQYGTLDTIDQWHWGLYYPRRRWHPDVTRLEGV